MKDEEMADKHAEEYRKNFRYYRVWHGQVVDKSPSTIVEQSFKDGFLAGLKAGRPQWHTPDARLPEEEGDYLFCLRDGEETTKISASDLTGGAIKNRIWYGTCSTGSSTTAKTVSCEDFVLKTGETIAVKFTNKNTGTCGCVFRIDESSGRVAYVSAMNPFQFQMCHAKDLVDINSSYMKGPFGGTRYVYFTFCYKNKRIKIPTFTSRNMYSLGSSYVQEGLGKAQDICNLLLKLQ